jgi:16S rRNA G966 N2-methylase RsmD
LNLLSGLDLSGGYGVDSYFFSQVFGDLIVLEPNKNLLDIAQHNHVQLHVSNIKYFNVFAEQFLNSSDRKFDFIYVDPSRRSKENRKLISLAQCEPNIISCQDEIWNATAALLVKTSPLLDIQKGIKELRYVTKVIVLSIGNECKELLFFCIKGFEHEPTIEAVDLGHENYSFSFKVSEEHGADIIYGDPLQYIYEPNASILKSGGFKTIAKIFPVIKLHPNTHLYSSDILIKNFPGRTFEFESTVKLDRSSITKIFPDGKANVTTRNYPLSAEELRKKAGLKDGGEKYLIGLTGTKKKLLIAAKRIF